MVLLLLLLASSCCAVEFGKAFRSEFFINASIIPLNNGAFGGVLRAVMARQIGYMTAMEEGCDAWFHGNVAYALLNQTRAQVAKFVGSDVKNLVLVDNASAACNAALRSLKLLPTDVIMRLSWEYPLGMTVSDYMGQISGAKIVTLNMSFPTDEDTVVREFEQGLIKYKPKIAFFDSIASYPAFILPSERLVPLCKQYGAMSIVDGAHAIGQIPLNLEALDADVYFSNGYKWLCSPKGSALMRVSPRVQPLIVPATLNSADPDFATRFWWTGTRDFSAWFSFVDAINYRAENGGESAWLGYNKQLCTDVFDYLSARWNVTRLVPASMTASLLTMPLPCQNGRCDGFQAYAVEAFMKQYNLQVVTGEFNGVKYVRFSCQVYNYFEEYVKFADLLDQFFAQQQQK